MAFKSIFIILCSPALIKRVVQLHIYIYYHVKIRCTATFSPESPHLPSLHYHVKSCCTSTMIDLIQQFSTLHHHPKSAVLQLIFLYSDEVVTFTTIRICAVHQRIKFDYQDFTAFTTM